nr:hypothetical protein Itr_chr11CG03120 [Ipomoea trifida]GMD49164.1 hypothetical protein Iba_chr11aCG1110 [Ipomoea batatas]
MRKFSEVFIQTPFTQAHDRLTGQYLKAVITGYGVAAKIVQHKKYIFQERNWTLGQPEDLRDCDFGNIKRGLTEEEQIKKVTCPSKV